MGKFLSRHRVLIAGILSSPAAAFLGIQTYRRLTRASADVDADFVFRLSLTTLAMMLPFAVTLVLARADRFRGALAVSGKVGLALGFLSLALTWLPIRGMIARSKQVSNLARHDVSAPPFDTVDLDGAPQRLADHAGKVVVVNAWATWCPPCKREMPNLDRLYRERKEDGLMVFGISTEEADVQRNFAAEEVSVTYPLLTLEGNVPDFYRAIQRYPATFLIDREGRLQPAPSSDEPFEKLEAAVDALLRAGPAPQR